MATARKGRSRAGNLLSDNLLRKMDVWWRAANHLNIGAIYLATNPLLKKPLRTEHIRPRLPGYWGHPGQVI
jgi:xylulose-5-phosphate/fructose-6-phosphate phosphoketolase